MTGNPETGKIRRKDGAEIAYVRTGGAPGATLPGVVFMTGYRSDMTGGKALELEEFCTGRGQAFLRFDYTGHGASSGDFEDGTIGQWTDDAVFALDELTAGPQVIVGSSMGGWVMLLTALARPERIAGMVGIAAAPDFTEDLIWEGGDAAFRAAIEKDGVFYQPSEYDPEPTPITARLIEDGRRRLLLRKRIPLTCPVRLIQGMRDPDVPWTTAQRLATALESADVEITFVKAGDHRLSEPHDLARLKRIVGGLCDDIAESGNR